MDSLEAYILRSLQGDKSAFRHIVQYYQPTIFSLAFRMLLSEDDAKDIAQETFIKVWIHLADYDNKHDFGIWVYTIAYRLCLMELRRREHVQPMPQDWETLSHFMETDSSDKQLNNSDLVSIIHTLVYRLSPKQRIVFTLICIEGKTAKEVSVITGMSQLKIKSNLYLARKIIRKQLKQLGYDE